MRVAPARRIWLPWLVAALAIFGGASAWFWPQESSPGSAVRFQVQVPGESGGRSWSSRLHLSPDGQYLAFVAPNEHRRPQIFLRRLDSLESKPLRNTEGAYAIFWSSDSESLAFSDGQISQSFLV